MLNEFARVRFNILFVLFGLLQLGGLVGRLLLWFLLGLEQGEPVLGVHFFLFFLCLN